MTSRERLATYALLGSMMDPRVDEAAKVLRAYGLTGMSRSEVLARVGVLDRMGAFAHSERAALDAAGFFDQRASAEGGEQTRA